MFAACGRATANTEIDSRTATRRCLKTGLTALGGGATAKISAKIAKKLADNAKKQGGLGAILRDVRGGSRGDEGPLGSGGTPTTSTTVGTGPGWRIDVENPAPGVRAGQLHFHDSEGNKYLYDFEKDEWIGMPSALARRISDNPEVERAISKGRQYLNVKAE